MKKAPLYSRSPRRQATPAAVPAAEAVTQVAPLAKPSGRFAALRQRIKRHERWFWGLAMLLLLGLALFNNRAALSPPAYTPKQIDAMVRQSLEEKPLSSNASKAYQTVRGSVVRVLGLMTEGDEGDDSEPPRAAAAGKSKGGDGTPVERGIGSGVVIIDNGTILTNLHVVAGARRIKVTFADGHVSDAQIINIQSHNDLAVLRARSIPDDLQAATMRSTADLLPGDEVTAVGFPFGIGPSVSSGVVSGLKREFNSPDGQQTITNMIQFDAAANPGNSGGPLVTNDGAVVGIVTAILNPSRQRTFIGIGFAVPIENAAAGAGMPPF
ncbi:S1C family serine protease [Piscinibacter sakaiensis]|uniref:S1C family serine protease n=1 Tax=Piscinibacter sakaiensis TaxID=1547922 RepID=UPI003AAD42AB